MSKPTENLLSPRAYRLNHDWRHLASPFVLRSYGATVVGSNPPSTDVVGGISLPKA